MDERMDEWMDERMGGQTKYEIFETGMDSVSTLSFRKLGSANCSYPLS
jgi:hypothetical protein